MGAIAEAYGDVDTAKQYKDKDPKETPATEERPTEAPPQSPKTARRLRDLQTSLDSLTDITDESERFRLEREIYDLERAASGDEWPEIVAG